MRGFRLVSAHFYRKSISHGLWQQKTFPTANIHAAKTCILSLCNSGILSGTFRLSFLGKDVQWMHRILTTLSRDNQEALNEIACDVPQRVLLCCVRDVWKIYLDKILASCKSTKKYTALGWKKISYRILIFIAAENDSFNVINLYLVT